MRASDDDYTHGWERRFGTYAAHHPVIATAQMGKTCRTSRCFRCAEYLHGLPCRGIAQLLRRLGWEVVADEILYDAQKRRLVRLDGIASRAGSDLKKLEHLLVADSRR